MIQGDALQAVPLLVDESGAILLVGARVTLDIIVARFKQGYTAEQIQAAFERLKLADVYSALAYYMQHEREVEAYLTRRAQHAKQIRCRPEHTKSSSRRSK